MRSRFLCCINSLRLVRPYRLLGVRCTSTLHAEPQVRLVPNAFEGIKHSQIPITVKEVDRATQELADFNWLQYESLGSAESLIKGLDDEVSDDEFWISTAHRCMSHQAFLETGVVKLLSDYSVLFDPDLDKIYTILMSEFIAKSPQTLLFQRLHKALYPRLVELHKQINWSPILRAALSSNKLESKASLHILHSHINLQKHGFYEHLIPLLIESECNASQIYRVSKNLLLSGDFPRSSAPHLDMVLDMLMKNKMYNNVNSMRELLCSSDRLHGLSDNWLSSRSVLLLLQAIGFSGNQEKEMKAFLNRFSKNDFMNTPNCWSAVVRKYKLKESLPSISKLYDKALSAEKLREIIKQRGVPDSPQLMDAFLVKTTKSAQQFEQHFMQEVDQIGAGNRAGFSPKALGSFFKVYLSGSLPDEDITGVQRAEKSLLMLGKFSKPVPLKEADLNYNNQIVRGYIDGLLSSSTIPLDTKVSFLSRLHEFMRTEQSSGLKVLPKSPSASHLRTAVQLDVNFVVAYLRLGMFQNGLALLDNLLDELETFKSANPRLFQFKWSMSDDDNLIPPFLAKSLVNTLIDGYTLQAKQRVSRRDRKTRPYTVMKTLLRMRGLDSESVRPSSWKRLLLNVAYTRSFEETFTFSEWLAESFKDQGPSGVPLPSISGSHHPLNVIFDDNTVFRFIRIGFLQEVLNPAAFENIESAVKEKDVRSHYQPWLPLEHLLRLSEKYGFALKSQRLQNDISFYLKMLYTSDLGANDYKWKSIRANNPYTMYELVERMSSSLKQLDDGKIDLKVLE
ncbi:unnamed protein product [Kuraishia capsulata CBS 1993]|uniref:Uncharacterized protein n=1 Tax=Kuraishia capsulata CBS 1993 TaxID=1382522 RepID=W6MLB4_9ASCO|nr:uncharacterized protein KUCA_T00001547001 [Kuraishia capsulata CBS 1993]CDK25577.1 unnamed protein product [Kuraishia capsulata CBS 1993]